MRKAITIATALVLAGCGGQGNEDVSQAAMSSSQSVADATAIKIADIDFFNMAETHEISQKLAPADAPLFLEYVINWKAAKVSGDESKILKPDGTAPVTVAEATALTKAVLAKNAGSQ